MDSLKLLTDEAVHTEDEDGLGFSHYAKILGDAAIGTEGPFTIGVFGEWGTGKTSLMRLIQSHLDRQTEAPVVTVWFNAWQYEKEEHLIIPLIATMLKQLEKKKSIWEKLKQDTGKTVDALQAIIAGLSLSSKIGIPGVFEVGVSYDPKKTFEENEKLIRDPILEGSMYFGAFERLAAIDASKTAKIVVLIDDLDRCLPDSAVRLLENIKLLFSQKGFIFVIGVARKIIEDYLTHRYKTDYGIIDFQGHSYLDKIIQLPFYLPSHRTRMEEYKKRVIDRLDASVQKIIEDIFPIVVMISDNNPRAIIRFINNIFIDSAVQKSLAKADKEEIPLFYFAITRCLQSEWNTIFKFLVYADGLCNDISSWNRHNLETIVEEKSRNRSWIAEKLLQDGKLQELLLSKKGKQWLKNRRLRHTTVEFLRDEREYPEAAQETPISVSLIFTNEDANIAERIAKFLRPMNIEIFNINTSESQTENYSTSLIIADSENILLFGKEEHPEWVSEAIFNDWRYSLREGIIILLLPELHYRHAIYFKEKHDPNVFDLRYGVDHYAIERMLQWLKRRLQIQ